MRTRNRSRLIYLALAICLLGFGPLSCSDSAETVGTSGTLVGGTCSVNADCNTRCLTDKDFPQGVCTVACDADANCPDGTACIEKEGGICLLRCELPSDCRGGYTCKGKKNRGHGGETTVCYKD